MKIKRIKELFIWEIFYRFGVELRVILRTDNHIVCVDKNGAKVFLRRNSMEFVSSTGVRKRKGKFKHERILKKEATMERGWEAAKGKESLQDTQSVKEESGRIKG